MGAIQCCKKIYLMKKIFLLITLTLMTISCAGISGRQTVGNVELGQEKDLVDTACSYFYFLWGSGADREKLFAEAQEAYEKALVCDPKAIFIEKRLSVLLARMGKPNQALMWMSNVVEQDPGDMEAKFWMARIYTLMEKPNEALIVYKKILEDDPENLDALYYMGAIYFGSKRYDEARDRLEELTGLYPESFAARKLLARLYREMRYWRRAAVEYNAALELGWNIPLALEAAGVMERVDQTSAITLYAHILEENETNENARRLLTNLYLRNGEIDNAIKLLEDLRLYSTDISKIDLAIGRILLNNDRLEQAIEKFMLTFKETPDFHVGRFFLARAYFENEDLDAALKVLQEVPTDYKAYDDVILLLLRIYEEENDFAAMETLLTNRIADPLTKKARLFSILASVYQQQQKYDLAGEVYKQGIIDFPNETNLLFAYGVFLEKIEDHKGAMLKMAKVLELDPDHALALNYVGYTWADNGVNLPKALEYIQKAVALLPEDGFVRDSLGWVFFRLGEIDRAIVELEGAIKMAPEDPAIHEHLGDAYQKNNSNTEARRVFEKAESLYSQEEDKLQVEGKIIALLPQEEAFVRSRNLVKLHPELSVVHTILARLYRKVGYLGRAVGEYNLALRLAWDIPLALETAGVMRQVDIAAAVSMYGQILEDDENNQEARQELIQLYLLDGEVDEAVKLLEALRPYSTEVDKIDFAIGRILLENNRFEETISRFLLALKEKPDFHVGRFFLARAYFAKQDLNAARQVLLEIPTDFKAYESIVDFLLRIYKMENDFAAMETLLTERLADPLGKNVRLYSILAAVYQQQQKNDLAGEVFEQGIKDFPNDIDLLFEYGLFLEDTGDYAGAVSKMLEVISLDPDHALALNHVGYGWADNGVNLPQALEYIQKAVTLRPELGFIRDSLGWVLFRMGELDRAIVELQKASALSPQDPTIYGHLADVYNEKGNVADALRLLNKAALLHKDEEKKGAADE